MNAPIGWASPNEEQSKLLRIMSDYLNIYQFFHFFCLNRQLLAILVTERDAHFEQSWPESSIWDKHNIGCVHCSGSRWSRLSGHVRWL